MSKYLRRVLGNLSDASSGVFTHVQIRVPEALQNVGEHLGFNHYLRQVNRVLRDLPQAAAYLSVVSFDPGDCLGQDRVDAGARMQRRKGVETDVGLPACGDKRVQEKK